MAASSAWRARLLTLEAMALLCVARGAVAMVPLSRWGPRLGLTAPDPGEADTRRIRQLAAHVERAAWRLPLHTKCLPRAMALSWMLRRRDLAHRVVLAARPARERDKHDSLHAWVESGGRTVLGELPGQWMVTGTFPRA